MDLSVCHGSLSYFFGITSFGVPQKWISLIFTERSELYPFCYKHGNNNKGGLFPSLCFLGNGGEFVLMQMVCGFQSLIQYVLVSRLCFCTCQALIVWKKRFHYSRSSDTLISWHQRKVSRYT